MIGNQLRKIRMERGYSLSYLAEQAGVSKSYLSYLERGIRINPSLQVLMRIAHTLDCNVESLLSEQIEEKRFAMTTKN